MITKTEKKTLTKSFTEIVDQINLLREIIGPCAANEDLNRIAETIIRVKHDYFVPRTWPCGHCGRPQPGGGHGDMCVNDPDNYPQPVKA